MAASLPCCCRLAPQHQLTQAAAAASLNTSTSCSTSAHSLRLSLSPGNVTQIVPHSARHAAARHPTEALTGSVFPRGRATTESEMVSSPVVGLGIPRGPPALAAASAAIAAQCAASSPVTVTRVSDGPVRRFTAKGAGSTTPSALSGGLARVSCSAAAVGVAEKVILETPEEEDKSRVGNALGDFNLPVRDKRLGSARQTVYCSHGEVDTQISVESQVDLTACSQIYLSSTTLPALSRDADGSLHLQLPQQHQAMLLLNAPHLLPSPSSTLPTSTATATTSCSPPPIHGVMQWPPSRPPLEDARAIAADRLSSHIGDHKECRVQAQQPQVGSLLLLAAVLQSERPPLSQHGDGPNKLGDDYYVNVGYAIRTLREELPSLFYKEMTYDIYRDDITFKDPLNTPWALRFHGRIFFKALWLDVNRVWQPNERTIIVRWTVRGIPRVPWEAQGRFDGTSEYRLDRDGKIYAHKVDNVAPSDPPRYAPLTVMELLRQAGVRAGVSVPPPTIPTCGAQLQAGSKVEDSSFLQRFVRRLKHSDSRVLVSQPTIPTRGPQLRAVAAEVGKRLAEVRAFSWVRFYLALAATLVLCARLRVAA